MKKHTFSNGLQVIIYNMSGLHSCEIGVFIGTGSMNDSAGKEGMTHLVEHMLFRGTEICPGLTDIDAAFEAIGGNVNARTDKETTVFHSRVNPKFIERGIELFASMMINPSLSGFCTEKNVVMEEIKGDMGIGRRNIIPRDNVDTMLWGKSKLGNPIGGFLRTVRSISKADLREFIGVHYVPENVVITIAGCIDEQKTLDYIGKHFGSWSGRNEKSPIENAFDDIPGPNLRIINHDTGQMSICIGFKSLPRTDPRYIVAHFIRYALCQNSGKLFSNLRGKNGLVYSIEADSNDFPDSGAFYIHLDADPKNTLEALNQVFKELAVVKLEGFNPADLKRYKDLYVFELECAQDSDYEVMFKLGYGAIIGSFYAFKERIAIINSITNDLVKEVSNLIFREDGLNIALVGTANTRLKRELAHLVDELKL